MTTTSAALANAAEELAEGVPVAGPAARPLDEDLLLDREVVMVARRGLQPNSGVHERVPSRVEVVQRLHQARPSRVLAGVLHRVDERPADGQAVHDVAVA